MSTVVDKRPRAKRVPAAASRERIVAAARVAFTRASYEAVGVREIAAAAAVDPAMIPRLFGSKEALFTQVARGAFDLDPAFAGPLEGLGERVARHLLGPIGGPDPESFDEFAFLLRSVGSPAAAPILAAALHEDFVLPLSERIGGADAETRAALATAYVLGFAVLRVGLGSPALERASPGLVAARLGQSIQECLLP